MYDVVKQNLLRWLGHVLRKDYGDWVKEKHVIRGGKCAREREEGRGQRGVAERDMKGCGLKREEAEEREK